MVGLGGAIVLAALALVIAAPGTRAETTTVTTVAFTYAPPNVTVPRGGSLEHANVDPVPHDVVSDAVRPDGRRYFSSNAIGAGRRAEVKGVPQLEPGTYFFHCSLHPTMRGVLTVRPAGGSGQPAMAPIPVAAVPTPTSVASHGRDLFVASYREGAVFRLSLNDQGLLAAPPARHATGFRNPLGIAFSPDGTLFVSDSHKPPGSDRVVGRVRAIPPRGGDADKVGEAVVDGLPNGRHNTNGLAVHGGRLYITNGNSTDDGVHGGPQEEPLSGTLLSVPLEARGLGSGSEAIRVEARGLRNNYDVAFRPGTDEAWMPVNGPDELDPFGEDTLVRVDISRDRVPTDFGFPGCVWRSTPYGPEPGQNRAVADTHQCNPEAIAWPELLLGLHVSADGLAFGPDHPPWNGDLFIAEYGNFTGPPAGRKVVRVPLDSAGAAGRPTDVLVSSGPLDVAFGPGGRNLYVVDFNTGAVLMVR